MKQKSTQTEASPRPSINLHNNALPLVLLTPLTTPPTLQLRPIPTPIRILHRLRPRSRIPTARPTRLHLSVSPHSQKGTSTTYPIQPRKARHTVQHLRTLRTHPIAGPLVAAVQCRVGGEGRRDCGDGEGGEESGEEDKFHCGEW
jgi:hypothetical protein